MTAPSQPHLFKQCHGRLNHRCQYPDEHYFSIRAGSARRSVQRVQLNDRTRYWLAENIKIERITAYKPARGVYQHVVTNAVPFRVQALQNSKRSGVLVSCNTPAVFYAVVKV